MRGPVEHAIRRHLTPGKVLSTPARSAPFVFERADSRGIVLLLGKNQAWTRLSWSCLEGIPAYIREHGGEVEIGGRHSTQGRPGTLDGYLKDCIKRTTANWVAVVLEAAGVLEVIRDRPARIRLVSG